MVGNILASEKTVAGGELNDQQDGSVDGHEEVHCQDWMIFEDNQRGGYRCTCDVTAVGSYPSCFGTASEMFRPRGCAVINQVMTSLWAKVSGGRRTIYKTCAKDGPGVVADENNRPRQIERECVRVWSCRCEATHHYVVIGR